jgi:hypothetical protein
MEGDIVFHCPHCEKSLSIDPRGAGLVVACPDCGEPVEVPLESEEAPPVAQPTDAAPPSEQDFRSMEQDLAAVQEEMGRVREQLTEVNNRRKILEKLRANNMRRMEKLAEELGVVQDALDRITSLCQDAAAEGYPAE